jgi:hypothetical protein
MDFQMVVHVSIRDDNEKHFDIDDIDAVCRTLNDACRYGFYPDSVGADFNVDIRPLSEVISC